MSQRIIDLTWFNLHTPIQKNQNKMVIYIWKYIYLDDHIYIFTFRYFCKEICSMKTFEKKSFKDVLWHFLQKIFCIWHEIDHVSAADIFVNCTAALVICIIDEHVSCVYRIYFQIFNNIPIKTILFISIFLQKKCFFDLKFIQTWMLAFGQEFWFYSKYMSIYV